MPGILYIVATPIGNLSDITFRAIDTLKTVDLVACEDTRRTDILMQHYAIRKPLIRYDEHSHVPASQKILRCLNLGQSIAVVTDAGTPGISDPGARLVHAALEQHIKVVPIPGPSSPIAALSVSAWGAEGFVFLGFLPRKPGKAKRALQEGLGSGKTVVILESPFRVGSTLQYIHSVAPQAELIIARELTKIHEEFLRGPVSELVDLWKTRPEKGEVVLLVRTDQG